MLNMCPMTNDLNGCILPVALGSSSSFGEKMVISHSNTGIKVAIWNEKILFYGHSLHALQAFVAWWLDAIDISGCSFQVFVDIQIIQLPEQRPRRVKFDDFSCDGLWQ